MRLGNIHSPFRFCCQATIYLVKWVNKIREVNIMWTRKQLKTNAKSVLKQSYWKALLVSFILGMVTGGGSSASAGSSADDIDFSAITNGVDPEIVVAAVIGIITVILGVIAFSAAFSIFAGAPIEVGAQR